MPFTRARTSATRNAEMRPGRSCVSVTGVGAIVSTPTSIGPPRTSRPARRPGLFLPAARDEHRRDHREAPGADDVEQGPTRGRGLR